MCKLHTKEIIDMGSADAMRLHLYYFHRWNSPALLSQQRFTPALVTNKNTMKLNTSTYMEALEVMQIYVTKKNSKTHFDNFAYKCNQMNEEELIARGKIRSWENREAKHYARSQDYNRLRLMKLLLQMKQEPKEE